MATSCCFTGHRYIPYVQRSALQKRLATELRALIVAGVTAFYAGGALGFDTLAAQTVLSLRREYPHIKLILILPCPEQTRNWRDGDVYRYQRIKAGADDICYVADHYTPSCMYERNRRLVEQSEICLCYLTRTSGGTAYTVRYARQLGRRVIHLG